MRDVLIAGAGMTRFGKFMDRSTRSLAEEATVAALNDAATPVEEVGMVFFGNAASGLVTGQEMIRGQAALRNTGLLGLPMVNVENACASASTAVHLAWLAVSSGQVEVAIALGAEKMTHEDKQRTFEAIGAAVDLEELEDLEARVSDAGAEPESGSPMPMTAEAPPGTSRSFFMDVYSHMARRYMEKSGATPRDFAEVAVKNHAHGALNPKAQYQQEVTVEEVLESREISSPLTLMMCSPIGDGAAALVLCSEDYAQRVGADAVRVLSSALVSTREGDEVAAAERAAKRAYELAGVGPEDLDVVELHDAAAPAELQIYEELELCAPGEGPELLASGATRLGGRVPVNTSGGLLSKGHPIGATGCGQLVELVDQLRGRANGRQVEGARVALAENAGGFLGEDNAAATVHILSE
ncbi:MAG: thiolase family protein [Actinomycetota bacterium]|nr:thiolase family protein [Actinomycetota bacterium]